MTSLRIRFVAILLYSATQLVHAQFVAFNDHDGRFSSIHPHTTTYSFADYDGQFPNVTQGRLKNITDGEFVDAQVRIEYVGSPSFPYTNGNTFTPGTPAALIFGCVGGGPCFADFRDNSARVGGARWVTHTFLGLNPARKYQFIGTGMGTWPPAGFSNDTTHYTITGAVAFVNAHTTNCVLPLMSGYPASNAVIVPTGRNHEPGFGDMAVWNDIRVGSNGSFTVESRGNYGLGSPINGFRLVEDFIEPTPPFVSRQPAHVNASRNSTQRLSPTVGGSLPLYFQWFKGASLLPDQTNRVLTFASLQPEDAGTYWLLATNPYGAIITSNATVTVANDAVAIVNEPLGQALRQGNPLFLSVSANGTAPLSFQWFKDGVAIPGAQSNSFLIGAAGLNHAGIYSLSVSNLFSSATSADAVVTVTQTPLRIVEQPQSLTVTQGTTLRVQVAVAGSAPRFQWFRNGAALSNGTNSAFVVTSANTNSAGDYFVIATNQLNAVTSLVATITISPPPAPPPPPAGLFPLISLTNAWSYDQRAFEPDANWNQPAYWDNLWMTGRGVFAIEDNALVRPLTNTILRLQDFGNNPIITSHFRTHFLWPTSSIGASLLFSNLIDDGAIFYLNGVELFRYNMPDRAVNHATFALAANPAGEGVFVMTNIPAPMILEGDNVLAVEVHQVNAFNSDIVFGTAVFGYRLPEEPLSIAASPTNQTVIEGKPLELRFQVNAPARFQWYHNGVPISGAPGNTFSRNAALPSDAGQYFAIATNSFGAITSAVAVVQVIADTYAPRVLNAVLETNRGKLRINFDELLIATTATNLTNYRVLFADGTEAATVVWAGYSNAEVRLWLSHVLPPETNLVLRLDGIMDTSAAANQLQDFRMTLRQTIPLVPIEGVWKYDDSGGDLGTEWRSMAYNDSSWPSGPALFYNDSNFGLPETPPPWLPTNTMIRLTNNGAPIITHYFRTRFSFLVNGFGAQLSMRTLIDDGAVIYLNGSEFFRLGVTNIPVYSTNIASRNRGTDVETIFEGPFTLAPAILNAGDNLLAVEVHPFGMVDVSFGLELNAIVKSFANEPVRIVRHPAAVFVREGEPYSFEVDSLAATGAQWLRDGNAIPGATTEILSLPRAALADHGTRFSVMLSNTFSFVLSSNATLHVLADTSPPALLSANAYQSLTDITLTFSELLDAASVSDLSRYTVRSSDGSVVQITGAQLVNGTNVLLATAPRISGRNYEVRVSGLRDDSAARNEIEPNSGAMIGYDLVLVPLTATWRYDQSGNGNVEAWKLPGFDDSEWPVGQALLYNDTFATVPAVPVGTVISQTNVTGVQIITHYFRHAFNLPALEAGAALLLRHAVDDGVVIYLNGMELLRTNVPAGGVDNTTRASVTVPDAVVTSPMAVTFASATGPAVFAAELHQVNSTLSDVAFAAELTISRPSTTLPSLGPALTIRRLGEQIELSWSGANYLLEFASAIDGQWSVVQGTSSPLLISDPAAAGFYRLRKP